MLIEGSPVMTSLETTGKDIAGLEYPAVTICGQVQTASFSLKIIFYLEGYDLSGLEDAVEKRFDEWLVGRAGGAHDFENVGPR